MPFQQTKDEDETFNDLLRRYGYEGNENADNQRNLKSQEGKFQNATLSSSRSAASAPPHSSLRSVIQENDSDEDSGGIFHLTSPSKRDS